MKGEVAFPASKVIHIAGWNSSFIFRQLLIKMKAKANILQFSQRFQIKINQSILILTTHALHILQMNITVDLTHNNSIENIQTTFIYWVIFFASVSYSERHVSLGTFGEQLLYSYYSSVSQPLFRGTLVFRKLFPSVPQKKKFDVFYCFIWAFWHLVFRERFFYAWSVPWQFLGSKVFRNIKKEPLYYSIMSIAY